MQTARRLSVLRERINLTSGQLDTHAGVIRGVRVTGLLSSNRRKYLPEALRNAVPLYEGASVRINHPGDDDEQRDVNDVLGWLKNVRYIDGKGIYADLHYLKTHPFAARLQEAALRNPKAMGLSHNAEGDTEVKDGYLVVKEITEVRSVDLVADPATTTGLFESRQGRNRGYTTMKLREWFDRVKLLKPARKSIQRLFEMGYLNEESEVDAPMTDEEGEAPMPADPGAMDPEAALKQGFSAAMHGVLDDDALDVKAKIAKISQLLKVSEKLLATGEDLPEEEDPDLEHDEPDGDEGDDAELKEGEDDPAKKDDQPGLPFEESCKESKNPKVLRRVIRRLEAEKQCRELCDEANIKVSATLMEAMISLPTKEKRAALLEEHKRASTPVRKARSSAGDSEKSKPASINDTDSFVRAITSAN